MSLGDRIPARIGLAIITFFGFINLYLIRFSFSVVSVAMITPFHLQNTITNSTCQEDDMNCTDTQETIQTRGTLDWSERQRALSLSMFSYGYCLTQIIGGRLSEKYGTKITFGTSVVIPAALNFLVPVSAKASYWGVAVIRFIQGILQGFAWPTMNVMLAHWFPPSERSRFVGIVALGATFGMIFILPFSGFLCDYLSWEIACYILGILPLIWGVFWFWLMHSKPKLHPRISKEEREFIETAVSEGGTRDIKSKKIPWKGIMTSLPFAGAVVCDFGNSFGKTIYASQMPNYLGNVFNYSMTKTGFLSGLPFLFRYCGSCLFSSLADFFIAKKTLSVGSTRRIFSAIAMFGPALVIFFVVMFLMNNMTAFISLICLALFLNGGVAASQLVNCVDIAPNYSGTLFGISNTFSGISSFVCILITGEILHDEEPTMDQWKYVFWLSIPVMVVTEIFYLIFLSGEPQPWNFYEEEQSTDKENVTDALKMEGVK